ncbi:hypothetical protein R50073_42500 [Maricurvus nonylphenolicus]|uniref:hypothetical protein n=1 Tax=Maricurvus nonylphenolicus TaxID=1008307 RepID=UPI0036F29C41
MTISAFLGDLSTYIRSVLWIGIAVASSYTHTADITFLSASPFDEDIKSEEFKTTNVGHLLMDKILSDSKYSQEFKSMPTLRVHQAISQDTYPNWVFLAAEFSTYITFPDLAEKYDKSEVLFQLQCAIISKRSNKTSFYALDKDSNARLAVIAHKSEVDLAVDFFGIPIKLTTVKSYSNGIKMLLAERVDYLAMTVEGFGIAAAAAQIDKDLFTLSECSDELSVGLLYYIDKNMEPELKAFIESGVKKAIRDGTIQKLYDDFYGPYKADLDVVPYPQP